MGSEEVGEHLHQVAVVAVELAEEGVEVFEILGSGHFWVSELVEVGEDSEDVLNLYL